MINRKGFKEVSFLWIGSLLSALTAFLTQIILARKLGVESFGLFSTVISMTAILMPLAIFGVGQYWLKVFGTEGIVAKRWLRSSFILVMCTTLTVILLNVTWSFVGSDDDEMRLAILIMTIYLIGQVIIELVSSRFQLEEKFLTLAIWQLMPHALRFVLLFALLYTIHNQFNLLAVTYVYAGVSLLSIIIGIFTLQKMVRGDFDLKGHSLNVAKLKIEYLNPKVVDVLSNSWPFGLAAFFHLIYFQSDIIFLKYIVGDKAAGYYNVAFSIMVAVYLLPGVIYQKYLLPKMHRWANHDEVKFYQVYRFGNKSMLILGTFAMFGLWATGFLVIPLLFGKTYSNSIVILNILALSAPIIFLAFNSGATLVTKDNMRRKVKYMGTVAVMNIFLNILLIPNYEEVGAAIATVISNLILLNLYYQGANKYVFDKNKKN